MKVDWKWVNMEDSSYSTIWKESIWNVPIIYYPKEELLSSSFVAPQLCLYL